MSQHQPQPRTWWLPTILTTVPSEFFLLYLPPNISFNVKPIKKVYSHTVNIHIPFIEIHQLAMPGDTWVFSFCGHYL